MSSSAEPGAPTTPYCYRHRDRETYISCQRCGRPICPDCMVQASVGFQCPECVQEASRHVRVPRTRAGGLIPAQAGQATTVIIAINVVVFVLTILTGGRTGELFLQGAMLSESARFGGIGGQILTGVSDGAYWRLITAAFLHQGILHIAFNMYALYIFGPMLERYLGVWRFVAMYLTTAVVSSVFVYFLSPPYVLTVGASGAVFGLFAVALVVMIQQRQDVRFLVALLGINVVISLPFVTSGISWQGHLGGFASGLVLGLAFAYAPRRSRTLLHVAVFGALWVGIVAGVLLRTAQLTV